MRDTIANPAGLNGPRPTRTTGRQREVLTNIASKQNAYPTVLIHRPGAPGAPGAGPKPGAAGAGPAPAATPFKVKTPDQATPSQPAATSSNPMTALLQVQKQTLASLQAFDLTAALARGRAGAGQAVASTAVGNRIVGVAQRQIGDPYVWGADGANAFDCSGLVYFSLNRAGIKVPRTTAEGYLQMSTPVARGNLQSGDLLFFHYGGARGTADHVGIYIGGGRMVVAPHAGANVQIQAVDWTNLIRGGRIR